MVKDDIKPMDKASEAILALRPVTFRYKKQIKRQQNPAVRIGEAEDVAKVNPDLVINGRRWQTLHRALRSGERDVAQ